MATKYLTQQNITGNVTIPRTVNENATYRALLTQTGQIVGTEILDFGGKLIIGETYTIGSYATGDDFDNIANVQSGEINETGCVFIATGTFPTNWENLSELSSDGGLIVDVLENTLGYDLEWEYPSLGPGIYAAWNSTTGPLINSFPRNNTHLTGQTNPFNDNTNYGSGNQLEMVGSPASIAEPDEAIYFGVWDWTLDAAADNALYYSPIEIKIKQDLDVTPVTVSGTVDSIYPFAYTSIRFIANGLIVADINSDSPTTVSDISELVVELNEEALNYFGTYSQSGEDALSLSIPTNIKNQLAPNATLTFEVFTND